jgi:carbonic anhydrase/acetyltransferase-like protein (isoleucine patch superfamily)
MAVKIFKGKSPQLGMSVFIDDSAVVIGDVILEDDVSIWPTTVIRGDVESVKIGAGTNVQDGSVLHVTHEGPYSGGGFPLSIGKGVTIGHRAVIHACAIGDFCLIGMGAIILDSAVIEDYVIVGAGSLIPSGKRLESGYLYVGSPARQIRPLKEAEKEFLHYSYQHYIDLKNDYLNAE